MQTRVTCLALAIVAGGCVEVARCPDGQRYDATARACVVGAPSDGGQDADVPVDAPPDAPPCGGACAPDHCISGACVDCLDASECDTDPDAPICGPGGTCVPCDNDENCAMADATRPTCTASGACVRCDAANETAVCTGARTCDIPSGACVMVPPATRRTCESCGSDRQCQAGLFCVPMTYGGTPRPGGYCLPPDSPACARPFMRRLMGRETISGGAAATYCGPNEDLTTCEAVLALVDGVACPMGMAAECMAEGAICDDVVGAARFCSYPCATANDCPTSIGCAGLPTTYCGG